MGDILCKGNFLRYQLSTEGGKKNFREKIPRGRDSQHGLKTNQKLRSLSNSVLRRTFSVGIISKK